MNEDLQTLRLALQQMDLALTDQQQQQLIAYVQLLHKWNKAYNLTAVKTIQAMITRHLIDSLSIVSFINENQRVIDVGSGPGLPGIPLAICRPDLLVTTVDSNGKKTRFQQQVQWELNLLNLTIINARAEDIKVEPFDRVISRAFASLADMLHWTQHLCQPQGFFVAMKGQYPQDEIAQLPKGYVLQGCHAVHLPDNTAQRHVLIVGRA